MEIETGVNDDTYTEIISSKLKDGDMVILSIEEKVRKTNAGRPPRK